tara:strand:+ start:2817 stop:3413 length:597 start_codon:yes stop_codon:yes gene_type:complete
MTDTKVILTDADGVLLNWRDTFDAWMARRGYIAEGDVRVYDQDLRYNLPAESMTTLIRNFNASANIGFLPPLYDSRKYVRKLYEDHGHTFLVVTSLSKDPYACKLRTENLSNIFGKEVFEDFIYLDTGAEKNKVLKQLSKIYKGAYWIEDKVRNAKVGRDLGFESLLMAHPHIKMEDREEIPVMKSWKELYGHVTGEV